MYDAYIGGRFRWMKITCKASDAAENLQLNRVVRFFHPISSCTTMHISADVQRITLNASCMTISGRGTNQLDIFCHVTGFNKWFSQFHSCGTYSVLSRSPSYVTCNSLSLKVLCKTFGELGLICADLCKQAGKIITENSSIKKIYK